jgi:hypothetical protein
MNDFITIIKQNRVIYNKIEESRLDSFIDKCLDKFTLKDVIIISRYNLIFPHGFPDICSDLADKAIKLFETKGFNVEKYNHIYNEKLFTYYEITMPEV